MDKKTPKITAKQGRSAGRPSASASSPLNPKQSAFCIEYIKDHNATQAAIRAGYSPKTAVVQGSQLLTILKVQDFIAELEKDAIPDAEEIARSNVKFWQDIRESQEERTGDRLKASELLGDSICQFPKTLTVKTPDGGPFGVLVLSHAEAIARLAELREKQDAE